MTLLLSFFVEGVIGKTNATVELPPPPREQDAKYEMSSLPSLVAVKSDATRETSTKRRLTQNEECGENETEVTEVSCY